MDTNSTSSALTDDTKWEIVRHSVYICQGTCIALFNSLIVLTIWRQQALRSMKEYTILRALAFADCISGMGTLMAGIHRIPLWLTHRDLEPASGRYCLLTGHNLLWAWFTPAAHAMLVVVSLDRLLSVLMSFKYQMWSNTYAFCVSGVAYGTTFVGAGIIFVKNWPNIEPVYDKICWSSYAYGMDYSYIQDTTNAITTLTSVAIYMCVPILYRNRVAPTNDAGSHGDNFQKRLNKSAAISCAFTFVFVGLPWMIHVWMLSENTDQYELVAVWMFIVANINPMLNLFIYYHKQIYFKIAFKALFKNKTLPAILNNWQTSN